MTSKHLNKTPFKKLHHRPFLVITHAYTPAKNEETGRMPPTHVKGWQEKKLGEMEMHETASFVDSISTRMLESASVIIDLLDQSLVKNRQLALAGSTQADTDREIVNYFLNRYQEKCGQCLMHYFRKFGMASQPLEIDAADAQAIERLRAAAQLENGTLVEVEPPSNV